MKTYLNTIVAVLCAALTFILNSNRVSAAVIIAPVSVTSNVIQNDGEGDWGVFSFNFNVTSVDEDTRLFDVGYFVRSTSTYNPVIYSLMSKGDYLIRDGESENFTAHFSVSLVNSGMASIGVDEIGYIGNALADPKYQTLKNFTLLEPMESQWIFIRGSNIPEPNIAVIFLGFLLLPFFIPRKRK